MKKKILLAALIASLSTTVGVATLSASADVVGQQDTGYSSVTGDKVYYAADGYSLFEASGWGHRVSTTEAVKFDGLTVSFYSNVATNGQSGDCVGFYFSNNVGGAYFGDTGLAVTNWLLYGTQSRLVFASSHDYNGATLVYTTPECTDAGFGVASSHVSNIGDPYTGYSVSFNSYNEELYEVTISMVYSTMWSNNANYDAEKQTSTVYLKKSTVAGDLDENGYTHVLFSGFPSGENAKPKMYVKVEDDLYRTYATTTLEDAKTKVAAYKTASESIETAEDFDAAMTLRTTAVSAVNTLRARDKAEQTEEIGKVDSALAEDPEIVAIVKKAVTDKTDAAQAAFDAFKTETNLTDDAYRAAVALIAEANTEYTARAGMLDEAAKTDIDARFTALNYAKDYYKALTWVIGYEKTVADIDVQAETVGDDIKAAKALKAALAGSSTETLINAMTEEDKTAVNARITAADTALATKESEASVAVKSSYVEAFETALEGDLVNSYSAIENAFTAYNTLKANIELTEADGELYTRFAAGEEAMYTALETFVKTAINAVSIELDGKFATLQSFATVKGHYNEIVLTLLNEERTATAEIKTAYEALTAKLKANVWYNFSQNGCSVVEQNETGIYFEHTPAHPARINYNEKLNMADGINIEIEFTDIAYYNGDKTEAGASKGANNLCFNFLSKPGSYKGLEGAKGLNVIIWLFEQESSVQVVNMKDAAIANGVIATPINGGKLTINLKHGMYEDFVTETSYKAYILTVNGVQIVISDEVVDANELEISDECYFSLGSFADYKADPNCLTVVSVNGKSFAKAEDDPTPPPTSGDTTSESTSESKEPSKKSGCGSVASVGAGLTLIAALAVVCAKKKND